jgi:hypothetical protein
VYQSYPVPNTSGVTALSAIGASHDGVLWFGAQGKIFRMTTGGVVTEYPLPNPNTWFSGMAPGLGGMWFTESDLIGASLYFNRIGLAAPLGASLSVAPSTIKQGSDITLTGSGFAPGETVNLLYSADIGKMLPGTIMADSSGSFAINGQAGPAQYGDGSVSATGQGSGRLGVANVMVMPRLILGQASGSRGTGVTASASGLFAGSVNFVWQDPQILVGVARVDPVGQVKDFMFMIPGLAKLGEQQVIASPYPDRVVPPAPNGIVGAHIDVVKPPPSQ